MQWQENSSSIVTADHILITNIYLGTHESAGLLFRHQPMGKSKAFILKKFPENIVKTQVAQDLGFLSRRGVERILRGEETLKDVLERRQRRLQRRNDVAATTTTAVDTKPVVKTYKADSRRKIVDTEDVRNISRKLKNGNIRSETIRTEKHEVFDDKAAPDDDDETSASTISRDFIEKDAEKYHLVKKDEFTDFFRVARDDAAAKGRNQCDQIWRNFATY